MSPASKRRAAAPRYEPRCSQRACPWPAASGNERCAFHLRDLLAESSMLVSGLANLDTIGYNYGDLETETEMRAMQRRAKYARDVKNRRMVGKRNKSSQSWKEAGL